MGVPILGRVFSTQPSPHDEVVAVDLRPIAGAAQVARVAHHGAAPAVARVAPAVGVLARHDLEELAQHLLRVVGLELGLQHLRGDREGGDTGSPLPAALSTGSRGGDAAGSQAGDKTGW